MRGEVGDGSGYPREIVGIILYTVIMLMMGIIALYGADILVSTTYHVELSFVERQLMWMGIGFIGFLLGLLVNPRVHRTLAGRVYFPVTVMALAAVFFFPPIGNAHRWIDLGTFMIQPSEFAKIVLLILLARYVEHARDRMDSFLRGILVPFLIVAPILILILIEPDLSTAVLMGGVTLLLLYVAGVGVWRILTVVSALGLTVPLGLRLGLIKSYQLNRVKGFVDLWTGGHAFQQRWSQLALASGGFFGTGPGLGTVKRYIPVKESDFIFSVFGEEFGIIGVLVIFALLLGLVSNLFKVANRYVSSVFGRYYIYGLGILLIVQTLVNVGVNVGLLPPTGVPLPFMSYGGSSMVAMLTGLGIAISMVLGDTRG